MADLRDVPLHDPGFYAGDPFPGFRRLRAESPVHWHDTPGFWALSRHDDVQSVSRDPATFCSSRGVLISDIGRPMMPRESVIFLDPPDHTKYRKLVQPAFSPGRLRVLEARIRDTARRLLADMLERSAGGALIDFVDEFAVHLPLLMIADMLGIPAEDRGRFRHWSDLVIEAATEQTAENMQGSADLLGYFSSVVAQRRETPGDDVISTLVHSRIDGEALEEWDLLMFCLTLLVAGNETTRNLLSHGMLALATHPDQRSALARDPGQLPRAIEEMLRWGSPVGSFMRTATRDAVVRGRPPIVTRRCSALTPTSSVRRATPAATSRSGSASISASAPPSPAWRAGSPWRSCCRVSPTSSWPAPSSACAR
jgi:cytochrome P450